ncbi:quinone oxidoreductase family protein [Microbacterium sp. 22242]|uniref:quinone oxidoreductase family protein n=1 Tax=Microbacterium sp. 22242 TaxID=3453896 RepID=UPI003F847E2C
MKVFEITEPGDESVLRYAEREPVAAGPGQLLVRVAYAGLNFTDVLARRGAPGYASGWPFVPGMEVGGTVEAVGDGVTGFAPGDAVAAFASDGGGYAELAVADARLAALVPHGVDLPAATTIPVTWATAAGLLARAGDLHGARVLVTSAGGGVGAALGALLARSGAAAVVGGVGSARKSAGSDYVTVVRDDGFFAAAADAAGGPFDLILDSVGGSVLAAAVDALAAGGILLSYGAAAGEPDPQPPAYGPLRGGNRSIGGFSILNLARTAPDRVGRLIGAVVQDLAAGLVIPPPEVVAWDELQDAHVRQSAGAATGKTVVRVA